MFTPSAVRVSPEPPDQAAGQGTLAQTACCNLHVEADAFQKERRKLLAEIDTLDQKHQAEIKKCIEQYFQQQALIFSTIQRDSQTWWTTAEPPPSPPIDPPPPSPTKTSTSLPKSPSRSMTRTVSTATDPRKLLDRGRTLISRSSDHVATATEESAIKELSKHKPAKHVSDCLSERERTKALGQMSRLQRWTASRYFEWGSGILIMLNAILLGWEVQFKASTAWELRREGVEAKAEDPIFATVMAWIFNLAFCTELAARWYADGFFLFFQTSDYGWNVFDITIVGVGMVDLLLNTLNINMTTNISVLRVLRVVRIVRVARIIRVMRFFRELRIMIFSILGSFKSLTWVALILCLIFYVSGITLTLGVVSRLETLDPVGRPGELSSDEQALYQSFGTLAKSVMSLYMSMSGGNDWIVYYEVLDNLPPFYKAFFVAFVTFAVFAVVNIVTGVFVDTAVQSNQMDKEIIVSEELEQKKEFLNELGRLFASMDTDKTGRLSQPEFEDRLSDERVVAYFSALKLDVTNAKTLFELLDRDQSGEIEIKEFLQGCYRLQGSSTALDSAIMQYEIQFLREAMVQLTQKLFAGESSPGGRCSLSSRVSQNFGVDDSKLMDPKWNRLSRAACDWTPEA